MSRPFTRSGQKSVGTICRSADVAIEVDMLKGYRLKVGGRTSEHFSLNPVSLNTWVVRIRQQEG